MTGTNGKAEPLTITLDGVILNARDVEPLDLVRQLREVRKAQLRDPVKAVLPALAALEGHPSFRKDLAAHLYEDLKDPGRPVSDEEMHRWLHTSEGMIAAIWVVVKDVNPGLAYEDFVALAWAHAGKVAREEMEAQVNAVTPRVKPAAGPEGGAARTGSAAPAPGS